jgi:hypothetical protein
LGVVAAPLSVSDTVLHGEETFKIATPSAIYYYQKPSAAFARVLDKDGNDWVGHKPGGGASGEYRGIPNLGDYFGHPGIAKSYQSTSSYTQDNDKVTITSTRNDGKWKCTWDIYATHATMTLLKAGGNYWILYEGTPFGKFAPSNQYSLHSDGTTRSLDDSWDETLASPQWLCFGQKQKKRVLFYALHEGDELSDQYFPYGAMTVFGFSRQGSGGGDFPAKNVPLTFSFGLLEEDSYAIIKPFVNGIINGTPSVVKALPGVSARQTVQGGAVGSSFTLTGRQVAARERGVTLVRQSDGVFKKQLNLSGGAADGVQKK